MSNIFNPLMVRCSKWIVYCALQQIGQCKWCAATTAGGGALQQCCLSCALQHNNIAPAMLVSTYPPPPMKGRVASRQETTQVTERDIKN